MFSDDNPRTWSDMSFEFKGMFVYYIVMMAMMLVGGSLVLGQQIAIAAGVALLIALASFIRRIRRGWRWRGITALRAIGALVMAVLMGYFLFATAGGAMQAFAVDRPAGMAPWALAVLGIAVFSVLKVLRIAHVSEKAFQEECGEQASDARPERPLEPRWKVITKYVFAVAFIAIWLEGVTFFYVYDRTFRSGAPTPTAERTVAFTNKGVTVYVTPAEKDLVDQLRKVMFIGFPAAIVTGLFLQFVLKIRFNELQ